MVIVILFIVCVLMLTLMNIFIVRLQHIIMRFIVLHKKVGNVVGNQLP